MPFCSLACQEKTPEGKVLGSELRKVRSSISLSVCIACKYCNAAVLQLIKNHSLNFTNTLSADTTNKDEAKQVKDIIGSWPAIDGDNAVKAKQTMNEYANEVASRCIQKNVDTSWIKEYRDTIKHICEDYDCYFTCKHNNNFDDYSHNHPNGLFNSIVPTKNTDSTRYNEKEPGANPESETTPNISCDNDNTLATSVKDTTGDKDCPDKEKKDYSALSIVLIVLLLFITAFIFYRRSSTTLRGKDIQAHQKDTNDDGMTKGTDSIENPESDSQGGGIKLIDDCVDPPVPPHR